MRPRNRFYRASVAAATALVSLNTAAAVQADPEPVGAAPSPFPDIEYYDQRDAGAFNVPGADGTWFLSPTGQSCGIWDRGSFGCAGDVPGAPAGTRDIGWISGDRAVHYGDWTLTVRFPGTQAQQPLPPRAFIKYQGTTCAATGDNRTYCERGPYRFVIEPNETWLSSSNLDLSWMQVGPVQGQPSPSRR